ncbi:MAG: endonuclease/exonuclease/phosphatase family protein [Elusimicrobia bacterium]|nr:endonuclease/exonuclease/phosphatase family protein [Elusimicrobiota bacterium]
MFLPAAALALLLTAEIQAAGLTIFNANILYCNPIVEREPHAAYMIRLDKLIAKINAIKPDVIAFQEMANCEFDWGARWIEPPKIIAQRTGFPYIHWISEGFPKIWEEGLAFYWNPATVAMENIRCRHLKATKRGAFNGTIKKSLCRGDIRRKDGRLLRLYNTHLSGGDLGLRQLYEILTLVARERPEIDAAVFTGDFNFKPDSAGAAWLKNLGFRQDAYNHVDYVFTWNLEEPQAIRIIDLKSDHTSDHDGLWLEIADQ